jgi:Undecaprenyl-phosphate galactose phosphotransferase WbaP
VTSFDARREDAVGARRMTAVALVFSLLLVVSDLIAITLSFALAFVVRRWAPFLEPLRHGSEVYLNASPAILVWPVVFWQQGLYPGYWLTARDELRRCVTGTTLASLLLTAMTFLTQTELRFSRPIVIGGWLLSLALVPLLRVLVRRLATALHVRGSAAVVLGAGPAAETVMASLRRHHPPPLTPVAVFDDAYPEGSEVAGTPILGPVAQAAAWARARSISTAIVVLPGVSASDSLAFLEGGFSRVMVVSDVLGSFVADVIAHDLQGRLALELRQNLLSGPSLLTKRALDLILLALSLPVTLPLAGVISLAILIETGPPVVFGHPRIGRGGRTFVAWKFRSMVNGADQLLPQAVAERPGLRQEWDARRKLTVDPRLTRVGKVLRRLSLDELPQLWNVLLDQMSLVGPRPIVAEEIERYGDAFDLYVRVPPGLTGLWQVSGRSTTTYETRVRLDTRYVRSWSIWMDLIILAKTVWVVIEGKGAY